MEASAKLLVEVGKVVERAVDGAHLPVHQREEALHIGLQDHAHLVLRRGGTPALPHKRPCACQQRRQREKPAQSETLEVAIASQRKLHQQRRAPKRDAAACSGLVRLPPGCPYLRGRLTVHKVHRGFELAHQNARLLPEHFVGHFGQGVLFGLQKSMAHPVRCARRIGLLFQRGAQRRLLRLPVIKYVRHDNKPFGGTA